MIPLIQMGGFHHIANAQAVILAASGSPMFGVFADGALGSHKSFYNKAAGK